MEKTETSKSSRRIWLVVGIVSAIACGVMMVFASQFFWLALPFMFTGFALAADYI